MANEEKEFDLNLSILVKMFLDIKDLRTKIELSNNLEIQILPKLKYYLVGSIWMNEFLSILIMKD